MVESYQFLGVWVNALTIEDLNELVRQSVQRGERWLIANHNMNSLRLFHKDAKMRDFYARSAYIHVDGMPLIWLGRLLGYPLRREHRVTYADWIYPLMADAAREGWRIFYLGSKPGVAQEGASILLSRYPGLEITTADGYFDARRDSEDNRALLEKINAFQPHVLMVGMGMPRQEHWVLDNMDSIRVNAILTAGAAIDYVAGAVPTPPRWAGKVGLEWLFRLVSEPGRLWRRYLVEPWFVLWLFIVELWNRRRKAD